MVRLARIIPWFVLPVLTLVLFTASARAEEEQKIEKKTGTLRLNLRLLPANQASNSPKAAEGDKNAAPAKTADEAKNALAEARKKAVEAKKQFDEAQAKFNEAQAKLEEARKKMTEARSELLSAARQSTGLWRVNPANPSQSVADAQKAYAERKREEQERLKNDPKWQPSHEPSATIEVGENGRKPIVNNFCLNAEGNLLVCCGGAQTKLVEGKAKEPGEREITTMVAGKPVVRHYEEIKSANEIRVISTQGQKLGDWSLASEPQAICVAEDGTVFVGGAGKLTKLDKSGKVVVTADAPNSLELPPPKLEPEKVPEGQDPEAAKKAREEKIAALQESVDKLRTEYTALSQEARKDLKTGDAESMKAYQEKIRGPQQKYLTAMRELSAAKLTPEMRFQQAQTAWKLKMKITSIAVSGSDVFLACPMAKTTGYAVWRTDLNFGNPEKIIESLSGCCSQMDIKAKNGEVWVAHNSKHKVDHFDRQGKLLSSFGKTDRMNPDGFGGCCEPKNLRFSAEGDLFAAESGPPTCVKRFSTAGEFLGVMAIAPWTTGCVRVTTEVSADGSRFYMLHSDENTIQVFTKKKAEAKDEKPAAAEKAVN
jgi:hypothetical protein